MMTVVLTTISRGTAGSGAGSVKSVSAESEASFADFLDGPSFAESGLFGRPGAQLPNAANSKQKADTLAAQTGFGAPLVRLPPRSDSIHARPTEEDSESGMSNATIDNMAGVSQMLGPMPHGNNGNPAGLTAPGTPSTDFVSSSFSGQKSERVFNFAELGMFGRYGAQPSTAASNRQKADISPVQAGLGSLLARLPTASVPIQAQSPEEDLENGISTIAIGSAAGSSRMSFPALREVSGDLASPEAQSQSGSAQEALPASLDFDDDPLPAKNDAAFRSKFPAPQDNSESPVNLVVSGSNDALVIVARSANGGDAGLHQLMKDTAAEFGMDVASFRLNGFASQRSNSTFLGGKNGGRAR